MMLSWMASAVLFGLCVALVAASAQPFVRALGRQTRWLWCAALAIASLWPVVATVAALVFPDLRVSAAALPAISIVPHGAALLARSPAGMIDLGSRVVLLLWPLASLALAIRLVRSMLGVRRIRATAEPRLLDGHVVLLTDDVGPATIGLRRPAVLVPRLVLALEQPLRALVLRHEQEHRAARDPSLLLAAAIAVVLFPWNAALWLIARRLHLALELDCDARVLDAGADPVRYGRLLLMIAQRQGAIALTPTFATPPSHLERRIVAMRTRSARPHPLHLAAAGGFLVLGLAGACSAGAPDAPSVARTSAPSRPVESTSPPTGAFFEFQVDQQVRQLPGLGSLRYPDAMRTANREGEVLTQFVVDEHGVVDLSTFKVLKSSEPAFTDAVRQALPTMRFTPARVKGKAVKQVVQQPFTFSLSRG